MECIIAFVIVVVSLGVLVVLGLRQHVQFGQSYAYAQLAKKYHGTHTRGGMIRKAAVRFRYGREMFTLSNRVVDGANRVEVTQIEVDWPDHQFHCEVFTGGFPRPASKIHMSQSTHPASRLAEDYQVQTNDDTKAKTFLSEGVQWELTKLRALRADREVHLSVDQGRLHVRKLTRLDRFEYLDEFTLLALELYDQAMLTRSDGIEFLDAGAAQLIEEARCQVCGEDIVSDMVFCRRCKTPHHIECWQYNGSCAIFGCQETRYAVPMVADPAVQPHTDDGPNVG